MTLLVMIVLAVFVGFIVTGFVWFGWGLTRNVQALRAVWAQKPVEEDVESVPEADE